jgi:hypothetical protein
VIVLIPSNPFRYGQVGREVGRSRQTQPGRTGRGSPQIYDVREFVDPCRVLYTCCLLFPSERLMVVAKEIKRSRGKFRGRRDRSVRGEDPFVVIGMSFGRTNGS